MENKNHDRALMAEVYNLLGRTYGSHSFTLTNVNATHVSVRCWSTSTVGALLEKNGYRVEYKGRYLVVRRAA